MTLLIEITMNHIKNFRTYIAITRGIFLFFFSISASLFAQTSIPDSLITSYLQQHNNFQTSADVSGNYTLDLNVEAIIRHIQHTGDTTYLGAVDRFFSLRNFQFSKAVPYEKSPFCDVYFAYFQLKKDSSFVVPYINESRRMMRNLVRTPEGAICIRHKRDDYMLIDYVQNYIARMAKTGWLTGDTLFYREAVNQLKLYRSILQYPDSKLYSQGRGWLEDKSRISPSAWSRGQGWMMRGLVTALEFMPANSVYANEMKTYLKEFADGLLKKQDARGMWHTLPLLPTCKSSPEVSGTAMIAYYMFNAYKNGFLQEKRFLTASRKAKQAVRRYISTDYAVHNISKGPGPLTDMEAYKQHGETNNPHGTQAVILLFSLPH